MKFWRIIISKVLEKKSDLVEVLSKDNKDIKLYSDIEWIWNKISDKTFNNISSKTQFLAEQIAIMYVSWLVWKAFKSVFWVWETVALSRWWMNLGNIWKVWLNTIIEWGGFYLSYTELNSLVNKEDFNQIIDDLNSYDAIRTIIFLWILRAINKTWENLSLKNITLDTASILWTDIVIRWISQVILWKKGEKINWVDFNNLENTNFRELSKFLIDELEFIVPLIIWLRIAEWWLVKADNKIEVITKENEYIIKIEWVKKDIRILRQKRNILKNKKKDSWVISRDLREKKSEYKKLRDNRVEEFSNQYLDSEENLTNKLIQENSLNSGKAEATKSKKSDASDNTSLNTWLEQKYADLQKFSKEAQEWKIDYVLKDRVISSTITDSWFKKWKWVWEWLLKKSGFSESEINEYNKWNLKSEKAKKTYEKKALTEMERANEIVYKEYLDWINKIKNENKTFKEAFPNLSLEILKKVEKVYKIDNNIFIRERNNKK